MRGFIPEVFLLCLFTVIAVIVFVLFLIDVDAVFLIEIERFLAIKTDEILGAHGNGRTVNVAVYLIFL